jgi:hypothetical protein
MTPSLLGTLLTPAPELAAKRQADAAGLPLGRIHRVAEWKPRYPWPEQANRATRSLRRSMQFSPDAYQRSCKEDGMIRAGCQIQPSSRCTANVNGTDRRNSRRAWNPESPPGPLESVSGSRAMKFWHTVPRTRPTPDGRVLDSAAHWRWTLSPEQREGDHAPRSEPLLRARVSAQSSERVEGLAHFSALLYLSFASSLLLAGWELSTLADRPSK